MIKKKLLFGVLIGIGSLLLALILLVKPCSYIGGWNSVSRSCVCKGLEVLVRNDLPVDGARETYCIGVVASYTNTETPTPQSASDKGNFVKEIEFEEIQADTRLKNTFNYDLIGYKSIINNKNEYDKLAPFIFTYDKHYNIVPNPEVYNSSKTILWFADSGVNASFTTLNKVIEYENVIEVQVTVFYSDFGSNGINFWYIPKTSKEVIFIEKSKSDGGI